MHIVNSIRWTRYASRSSRRLVATMLCLAVAGSLGCHRDHPPAVDSATTPNNGGQTETPDSSPSTAPDETSLEKEAENGEPTRRESLEGEFAPKSSDAPLTAAPTTPPLPTRQRLLLLPTAGPLIVELSMTDGDQSLQDSWREHVGSVLAIVDANSDDVTVWSEVLSSTPLNRLLFGIGDTNEDQQSTIARSYDANGDGQVQPDELLRLMGRNQDSWSGLMIQASPVDSMQAINRSPLRRWLDQNGDGILSESDRATAAMRLRQRDDDDDDLLFAADFGPPPVSTDGPAYQQRKGPRLVRIIDPQTNWSRVLADLEDIYAFGSALTAADLGDQCQLFDQLDENNDDELTIREFARLATVPPELSITVDMATHRLGVEQPPAIEQSSAAVETESQSPAEEHAEPTTPHLKRDSVTPSFSSDGQRMTVDFGLMTLDVGFDEPPNSPATIAGTDAKNAFSQLDADSNEYLDEQESLSFANLGRMSDFDTDGNDRIEFPEFQLLVRLVQSIAESGTILKVAPLGDPVFAMIDSNKNGVLESREIDRAGPTLEIVDTNRDGHLSLSEIGMTVSIRLTNRPIAQPAMRNSNVPYVVNRQSDDESPQTPAWFQAMDQNGDQVIVIREFLGADTTFDQLDKNGDSYLSPDEAQQMDSP